MKKVVLSCVGCGAVGVAGDVVTAPDGKVYDTVLVKHTDECLYRGTAKEGPYTGVVEKHETVHVVGCEHLQRIRA
jgi:hypothetical protein